jgi:DNA-binding transcriptional LysR family regulator
MDHAAREPYLLRVNCEFQHHISTQCKDLGFDLPIVHRSEKEDWIQSMVATGFGVTFLPEFSVATPHSEATSAEPIPATGTTQMVEEKITQKPCCRGSSMN